MITLSLIFKVDTHHQSDPGLILGLHLVNERRRYRDKVTPSLIGWAQTLNQ